MASRTVALDYPLDLARTLGPLRHGGGDPTIWLTREQALLAARTPQGPAAMHLRIQGSEVTAEACGAGAEWMLERVPELIGAQDDPELFVSHHDVVRAAARRFSGLRMCHSGRVLDALIPAILGQKVTSQQAHRSFAQLVRRYSEPAPDGLAGRPLRDGGTVPLYLPLEPKRLLEVPYYDFHGLGIERRRAVVMKEVCSRAGRMEEAATMTSADADTRLKAIPGVGNWTAACVLQAVLGDPDAVIVGDFHLPNIVAWNLAGEPRADDARMLELLKPYEGQRARAVRFLKFGGAKPPSYGPKHRLRDIAAH